MGNGRKGRVGRPPGPTPSRGERRKVLLDAAVRTIRRVGPGASMEDIAAEAGLSKPVLYAHFRDRSGLATALLEQVTAELVPAVLEPLTASDPPRERVRAAIDAFVAFIERETALYRFITHGRKGRDREAGGNRVVDGVADHLGAALAGALHEVGVDTSPAPLWSFAVLGSVLLGAEWWLAHPASSREEVVDHLTDLVWGGLAGAGLDRLDGPVGGASAAGGTEAGRTATPPPRRTYRE